MVDDKELENLIEKKLKVFLPVYLGSQAFVVRKITDTPTDENMVVPRGYVNMNGSVASRPNSSVATLGQHYFASDTKILMTYDNSNWYDGVGSIVASG